MIATDFAKLHTNREPSYMRLSGMYASLEPIHIEYGDTLLQYLEGRVGADEVIDASLGFYASAVIHSQSLAHHQDYQSLKGHGNDSPEAKQSIAAGSIRLSMLAIPSLLERVGSEIPEVREFDNRYASRLSLSLPGIQNMSTRHRLAVTRSPHKRDAPFELFSSVANTYRGLSTGFGNEIDVALVGLAICSRNPGLCYVPAPPRSERGKKFHLSLNPNVDGIFFTVHKEGSGVKADRALGVQIKSAYSQETGREYDEDSMIVIHGRSELGNATKIKTRPTSSMTETVSWPGHFAVRGLIDLSQNKAAVKKLEGEFASILYNYLPVAEELDTLYPSSSRFSRVVKRIEDSLVAKEIIPPRTKSARR